jgi:hypothetical protein
MIPLPSFPSNRASPELRSLLPALIYLITIIFSSSSEKTENLLLREIRLFGFFSNPLASFSFYLFLRSKFKIILI